jgi:AI-2 transport protein TqsA
MISPILRLLLGAACAVIVMGGIRAASPLLGPLLLGLLLAYAMVPFPKWIMRRFKVSKSLAVALTAVAALAFMVYMLGALDLATLRIAAKLPTYEERLASLYEQIAVFTSANGVVAPSLSVKSVFTPEHLREITRVVLPEAGVIISNGLLISLLAFLFVVTMVEDIGVKQGPLAEKLAFYASDAQSYVTVTAKTAGINALVKQAVDVSFLQITLSLVAWAFLLGLTGAILAIPLTLSLKKFIEKSVREEHLAVEPSG